VRGCADLGYDKGSASGDEGSGTESVGVVGWICEEWRVDWRNLGLDGLLEGEGGLAIQGVPPNGRSDFPSTFDTERNTDSLCY
jgi:hypothetical protein